MENQEKDQLVYDIDLNVPTLFSMVNGAKVNPEKPNAVISLDYIGNAEDGGAWTMRLEQGDKLGYFVDRVPFGILDKTITGLGGNYFGVGNTSSRFYYRSAYKVFGLQ